ncbi:MAG TPA: hypothetical protein ENF77_03005 [Candidatus Acetothermia bacterium]|nr:hypothetical protein [Candidatus Bipolaricaulota bacterium]HDI11277.1 hypothetical protein [Candidatus Acetothermia bacterium]
MQVTLYFNEEDAYLIRLVDEKARRERKSRSAVVLSILEEYFERDKRLGEILVDLKLVNPEDVKKALEAQRNGNEKPIGEILVEQGLVEREDVARALEIQSRYR